MGVGKVAVEIADCRRDDGHLRVTWHPEERVVNVSQWRRGICVSATPLELTEVPALVNLLVGALEEAARSPVGAVEPSGGSGSGQASGMDPARRTLRRVLGWARRRRGTNHLAQVIEITDRPSSDL